MEWVDSVSKKIKFAEKDSINKIIECHIILFLIFTVLVFTKLNYLPVFKFLEKAPRLGVYTGVISSVVSLIIYISQIKEMTKKRLMFYSTNTFFLISMTVSGFLYFMSDVFYLVQVIVIFINSYLVLLAFYKVIQIEASEKHFLSEHSNYFKWLIKHSKIEEMQRPKELEKYLIKNICSKKEENLKNIVLESHKRIEEIGYYKIIEVIKKI